MSDQQAMPDGALLAEVAEARGDAAFAVLGRHGDTLRVLAHAATTPIDVFDAGGSPVGRLDRLDDTPVFAGQVSAPPPYTLRHGTRDGEIETQEPYSFPPVLSETDLYFLAEGTHQDMATALGAHPATSLDVAGARFAVWAPNARRVSVVGDFNGWDGRRHQMRRRAAGMWDMFIPGVGPGTCYKYELIGPHGELLPLRADPVAWRAEVPPSTASIVPGDAEFTWTDAAWLNGRGQRQRRDAPFSVYEVHAPSWMRQAPADSCGWDFLTERLVPYVRRMGFTHVEFLPVMAHPFGGSWGYQPLSLFAPMPEMGPAAAFARLVDSLHAAGIGVILDWVPAHFPTDAHGLARFDGTALYEHEDRREGYHPDWNTLIYNLGRYEVRGFLVASALHWLEHFHIDGLRVDAVASMLYRDYSRKADEWIPNKFGGRENLEAIDFLRHLNGIVHARCPGVLMIAEESTAFPGVTAAPEQGGLGFDYKWNMGWMHDTLTYIGQNPVHRPWAHDQMTFGLAYAWSEAYVLPISHDEVVHGKGSLIGRMPGDDWQRFANLRAYLGFMFTHPGKKLLFMGCEFAQIVEWNHQAALDWALLDQPSHAGVQRLVRDLNGLYQQTPALHARDDSPDGFAWLVLDDRAQSVLAWLRFGAASDRPCLVVANFTPVPRHDYRLGVPHGGYWREVLNTDGALYGGGNVGNLGGAEAEAVPAHGHARSVRLILPPLAVLVLQAGPDQAT